MYQWRIEYLLMGIALFARADREVDRGKEIKCASAAICIDVFRVLNDFKKKGWWRT